MRLINKPVIFVAKYKNWVLIAPEYHKQPGDKDDHKIRRQSNH